MRFSNTMKMLILLAFAVIFLASCGGDYLDTDNDNQGTDGDLTDGDGSDGDDSDGDINDRCAWQKEYDGQEDSLFADENCAEGVCQSPMISVVPSDGLPPEVELQNASNNLDVVAHDCRVFLAFRTAPEHFASALTELYVVSSEDQVNWRFEGSFFMETDLREPRFLSFNGDLFLYFAVLGDFKLDFEPKGMMVTKYNGPGDWTEPEWFYGEGFIPWRTKVIEGVPYMLTYVGGENIYDFGGESIQVHWLTTEDGFEWTPVIPDQPVVITGGGSETDFVFLDDGTLIAVSRNELGDDETAFGMKICRAEADNLGDWQCTSDPKKYDSPILFKQDDRIFLIGRRNLTETGNYDLGYNDRSIEDRALAYELDYWKQPKRTSLWEVDPETLTVSFIMDLPSKGDTCFPGIIRPEDGLVEVYNYTSPVDGEDVSWQTGQFGPTLIYRLTLGFE